MGRVWRTNTWVESWAASHTDTSQGNREANEAGGDELHPAGRRIRIWRARQLYVESRSMGAGGEDLIMARAAREKFPYSVECKNQEKLNIWESYSQAVDNSKNYEPIVVIKRNNHKALVVVDAEYFVGLHKDDI